MGIRFYNTLTQSVEEFRPQHGNEVRMYTCGPTVYNFVHIGNLRTFTFQDILRRWLQYRGYKLNHVMNITDVDDKIIRNATKEGKTLQEYTEVYTQGFLEDTGKMRMQRPERMVKATEHIHEMVEAIQTLTAKGFTYESEGSTYYRINQFPEYGKLSHSDFSGMKAGARVEVDEYDKESAQDFVLWKAKKPGEFAWDTPIGDGRPGWHIECSAMAMKYLGETLDIHAGGIDLVFPHHENEIAQSEGVTGKKFANYWLHSEHLNIDMQKMSKSMNNFFTLRDLVGMGHSPEALRYVLASVPYRKKLNFTMEGLTGAQASIDRLRNYKLRLETDKFAAGRNEEISKRTAAALATFEASLDDDLNTAEALGAIFEYVRDTNSSMDSGAFLADNAVEALDLFAKFDQVFDVLKPTVAEGALSDADIDAKVAERNAAKKSKNFKLADEIRAQLLEQGIVIEDTKDGVRWKRK
jgi:cysteinyl-tRNA synthetase